MGAHLIFLLDSSKVCFQFQRALAPQGALPLDPIGGQAPDYHYRNSYTLYMHLILLELFPILGKNWSMLLKYSLYKSTSVTSDEYKSSAFPIFCNFKYKFSMAIFQYSLNFHLLLVEFCVTVLVKNLVTTRQQIKKG